ncbi:MAG: sigma-70 family RNA polymerase sigma factor [Actinomycetota bacterium]
MSWKGGMHGEEFLQRTLGAMDLVHNLARRILRDEQAAEDLVQETYLRAYDAWIKHRRPDKVEPWLATICLNLGRSELRRRRRRPEVLEASPGTERADPVNVSEEALDRVDQAVVRRALWELPEEQRIAITLVDLCGLTASEAANVMRSPRGTVLSRVHRGRKALAALVRREVEQHDP